MNPKSALIQCLDALPCLAPEELQQLHMRILYHMRGQGEVRDEEPAEGEDLLLDCIVTVLKGRGMELASVPLLRRQGGYPAFRAKVPGVVAFLKGAGGRRQDVRALMAFAVELLVEDMMSMNMAVGARNLMNHVHRIPSVINRAFPGYAQNGLLELLIKRKA